MNAATHCPHGEYSVMNCRICLAPQVKTEKKLNLDQSVLISLKHMAKLHHDQSDHKGYFHNCDEPLCLDNKLVIAHAEVQP